MLLMIKIIQNHSRFLIFSFEELFNSRIIVVTEVPFTHREELQYVKSIGDSCLDPNHTGKKSKEDSSNHLDPPRRNPMRLQSLLSHDKHEEINYVGRYPVAEEYFQHMIQFICRDRSVRIPDSRLEGIFVGDRLSIVDHLAPSHFLLVGAGQIVHGYVFWLLRALSFHVRNCHEAVDGKVNWDNLSSILSVAKHRANHALSCCNHNTHWTVQVVHPAG